MVQVGCAPYAAAKAGLNQLAFTIAAELAPHRINVNVIEPGWIDTPGEREAFEFGGDGARSIGAKAGHSKWWEERQARKTNLLP